MSQFNDLFIRHNRFGDFKQATAIGSIKDFFSFYAFGMNPDLDAGPEENLVAWGTYTFPTVAVPFYLSSTDVLDTGLTYVALLLDEDLNEVTVFGVTNGQSGVQLIGPNGETNFLRGQILFNNSPDGSFSMGDVYVGTEASPTGGEPADVNKVLCAGQLDQQTNQAIYTVPRGKTGLVQAFAVTTNRNTTAGSTDVYFNTKNNILPDGTFGGGPRRRRAELGLQTSGNSAFLYNLPFPVRVGEGSDIFLSAIASANNTRLAGGFQVFTVDNNYAER